MARPKKQVRAKEPVVLRFKELTNGNKSLYLDIYRDGKRRYEFLKLYLIPERPGVEADKMANRVTMDAANAIKAQRIKELITGEAGIKALPGKHLLLLDWMAQRAERAAKSAGAAGRSGGNTAEGIRVLAVHLSRFIETAYGGRAVTLSGVDKAFCGGFIAYLQDARNRRGGKLSPNTRATYYVRFEAALNEAFKKGYIATNPAISVEKCEKPTKEPAEKNYLTAEDLQALCRAECPNRQVRAAFLFSCFCGLRFSDIERLTWKDIRKNGDSWAAEIRMQKTRQILYLPLSEAALRYLPDRENKAPESFVFDLPPRTTIHRNICKWVLRAGINKRISFHCARHTFATLALTMGADLYSISKLLGHTSVTTTQVYAAVIDQRKRDTANLLNDILK